MLGARYEHDIHIKMYNDCFSSTAKTMLQDSHGNLNSRFSEMETVQVLGKPEFPFPVPEFKRRVKMLAIFQ